MRSRNLKPGFFVNEELAKCSPLARILFAGLWCACDREGRAEYKPMRFKAQILPFDNVDVAVVLAELVRENLVLEYVVDGAKYLWIPKLREHQRFHQNEAPSQLPPHPNDGSPRKKARRTKVTSVAHCGDNHSKEERGKRKEERGKRKEERGKPECVVSHFDRFWANWPDHSRKRDRGKCGKLWQTHGLDAEHEVIAAGLSRWRISAEWCKQDGEFIPLVETWLRNRRWEANPEPAPEGEQPAYLPKRLSLSEGQALLRGHCVAVAVARPRCEGLGVGGPTTSSSDASQAIVVDSRGIRSST